MIGEVETDTSNPPPNPVTGKRGPGEEGQGEGTVDPPPMENGEGVVQEGGGANPTNEKEPDTHLQSVSNNPPPPNMQQSMRPLAELLSELSSDRPMGDGEGPVDNQPTERGDGTMQEGGRATPEKETDTHPQSDSNDIPLPNAQQSKRPVSELSSNSPIVSEKRVRTDYSPENSSLEEPRVFPSTSPNQISFLIMVLQSTPKKSTFNERLRERPTPRVRKGREGQPPYSSPVRPKEELDSHEIG
ncbi:hypothetical protein KUCAC02_037327 [Chaenocephalus aceratus]|nr:hypothetical protein KUCAC02_037327 [Chaenocephalus aceratus]